MKGLPMEQSLQKYYEEQFNMMSTEGWKDLIEDFTELKTSINNITLTTDTQDLFFRKGQLDILDLVLKRKEACEKVYEDLTNG
jgi:hypothetical protein